MAGFVGICGNLLPSVSQAAAVNATRSTIYSAKSSSAQLSDTPNFILHRSFFGFLEANGMEASNEVCHVWVDGEIFNQHELRSNEAQTFSETLLLHYQRQSLQLLLPRVNGIYVAIIYDKEKRQLHFITDRYGLRPFYFSLQQGCLLLAPEVKCFPSFSFFELKIKADVIDCFIQLEHFLGNETWFESVEVAAPSMWYTYAWPSGKLTSQRYWSWGAIKRSALSIDEAAEAMGTLLDQSVKKRYTDACKVGIALSGGLDSRALLAAVHKSKPVTYTFGTEDSRDVKIAKRVAKLADVKHVYYNTYIDHWLEKRFSGVWKTDGMLNMFHMHYSHLMDEIPRIMDINLSGFLGDAVLGGTYLEKKGKSFLNQRINENAARHYYGKHFERCDLYDSFFDLDKVDPYLFYNRGRRMIGMGAEEPSKTVPQRLPFMDTDLMDLSYSLPDEFRANSNVYNRALLKKYNEFYSDIPHATTGIAISEDPTLSNLLLKKYYHLVYMFKYKLGMQTYFTNVHNWIKEPATAKFISSILDPGHAIYASFTSRNFHDEFFLPHMNGKRNLAKQVMGAVTMEVWFQQILNGKYLPAQSK